MDWTQTRSGEEPRDTPGLGEHEHSVVDEEVLKRLREAENEDSDDKRDKKISLAKLIFRLLLWLASILCILIGAFTSKGKNTFSTDHWRFWVVGGLVIPIWDVSTWIFNVLYGLLEHQGQIFTDRVAYFLIPLRNTLMNVFRWCMYLAGWASVMAVRHRESMYSYVLRAIVSVVLLWTARGLGIAFARGISIKFYSANYFTKMQGSIEKEFYLHALTLHKPKPRPAPAKGPSQYHFARSSMMKMFTRPSSPDASVTSGTNGQGPAKTVDGKRAGRWFNGASQRQLTGKGPSQRQLAMTGSDTLRPVPESEPSRLGSMTNAGDLERGVTPGLPDRSFTPGMDGMSTGPTSGFQTPGVETTKSSSSVDMKALLKELQALAFMQIGGKDQASHILTLQRFVLTHKPQAAFQAKIGKVSASSTAESIAKSAHRLTKVIFKNLRHPSRPHITRDDFEGVLPKEMVEEAFQMLNPVNNKCIIFERCEQSIKEIFTQRRELKRALKDSKTMVGSLRSVLVVVFEIATVMIILLIFRVQVGTLWVSLTSPILAFTFIFGNTLKTMFETLVIMFGPHPFDVEDKLVVPGIGWCNVLEVTLWQTVLVDWQGQHWHIPNSKLLAETIVNVTRSDTMGDEFAIWVDLETDFNIVDVLYEELDNFRKANPQHFGEWVSVRVQKCVESGLKIRLAVYYAWAFNNVDLGKCGDARNLMFRKVLEILQRHRIRLSNRQEVKITDVPPTPSTTSNSILDRAFEAAELRHRHAPLQRGQEAWEPRATVRPSGLSAEERATAEEIALIMANASAARAAANAEVNGSNLAGNGDLARASVHGAGTGTGTDRVDVDLGRKSL